MPRDAFDALIGISGGPDIAIVQQINLRQLHLQQSLGAYANHHVATPDVHIANRAEAFVPRVLGEDGQELTPERRRELMKGKPTMLDLTAGGADPMDVGHYQQLFTEQDILTEELGRSAQAARPGFRSVNVQELELASELLARQGLPGEVQDMTLCCYSAPCIGNGQVFWTELGIACMKLRALSDATIGPDQLLMSQSVQALLWNWRNPEPGGRIMGLPIQLDDRLHNEIRVCAPSSRPDLSGHYASLFIDQGLYDSLEIDPDEPRIVWPQRRPS